MPPLESAVVTDRADDVPLPGNLGNATAENAGCCPKQSPTVPALLVPPVPTNPPCAETASRGDRVMDPWWSGSVASESGAAADAREV